MADKILLLEKGLLAIGKHEDLMKSSQVYREINASQHGKEGLAWDDKLQIKHSHVWPKI